MSAVVPAARNTNAIHALSSVPTTQLTMKPTNETNATVRQVTEISRVRFSRASSRYGWCLDRHHTGYTMPVPTATATTIASICGGSNRARRRIAGRGISATIKRPNRVFKQRRSRAYWFRARVFAFIGVSLSPPFHLTCRALVDSTWKELLDISHAGDQAINSLLRDSRPHWSAERVTFHTKKAH